MLRGLYDRLMRLAGSRHAEWWLALVAFAESSFFPLPPDLLLIPMATARPERAWRYAAVTTAASVAGGMLGYLIGYALQPLGLAILKLFGHSEGLGVYQSWFSHSGLWGIPNGFLVILAKGLTPIPYKLVTIASGLAQFSFPLFVLASVLTRGFRFFLWAGILKRWGEPVRELVEKRLTTVFIAVLVLAGLGLLAAKLMH